MDNIKKAKKNLNFSVEMNIYLLSTIISGGVSLATTHTAKRIVSSAISFRLPSDSIPADASSDSPSH